MAYTIYRWDDVGAPAGLGGIANDMTLINVLDACLVNGYGSKAPAGWSKPFSGSYKAVYQQGAGTRGFCLRVESTPTWMSYCRGFESMSDVDTGTGPFPTVAQLSNPVIARSSNNMPDPRPWLIAADAKRFFLWANINGSLAQGLASISYCPCFFFGDLESPNSGDAFNTFISCGNNNPGNTYFCYAQPNSPGTEYCARAFNGTGAALANQKRTGFGYQGNYNIGACSYAPAFPDPVTGGLIMSPIEIVDTSSYLSRGVIPWVWAPHHNLPGNPGDVFTGMSGPLVGKQFMLLDSASSSSRCRIALELP